MRTAAWLPHALSATAVAAAVALGVVACSQTGNDPNGHPTVSSSVVSADGDLHPGTFRASLPNGATVRITVPAAVPSSDELERLRREAGVERATYASVEIDNTRGHSPVSVSRLILTARDGATYQLEHVSRAVEKWQPRSFEGAYRAPDGSTLSREKACKVKRRIADAADAATGPVPAGRKARNVLVGDIDGIPDRFASLELVPVIGDREAAPVRLQPDTGRHGGTGTESWDPSIPLEDDEYQEDPGDGSSVGPGGDLPDPPPEEPAPSGTPAPGAPVDPALPGPAEPDPIVPGPGDPGPGDPGPVDPGPVDPGPVDPGPVDPGPVDPGPTDPGPVDPGPVEPGPVEPGPGDPGGVEPGAGGPSPGVPDPSISAPSGTVPASVAPALPAPAPAMPHPPVPSAPPTATPAPTAPGPSPVETFAPDVPGARPAPTRGHTVPGSPPALPAPAPTAPKPPAAPSPAPGLPGSSPSPVSASGAPTAHPGSANGPTAPGSSPTSSPAASEPGELPPPEARPEDPTMRWSTTRGLSADPAISSEPLSRPGPSTGLRSHRTL